MLLFSLSSKFLLPDLHGDGCLGKQGKAEGEMRVRAGCLPQQELRERQSASRRNACVWAGEASHPREQSRRAGQTPSYSQLSLPVFPNIISSFSNYHFQFLQLSFPVFPNIIFWNISCFSFPLTYFLVLIFLFPTQSFCLWDLSL